MAHHDPLRGRRGGDRDHRRNVEYASSLMFRSEGESKSSDWMRRIVGGDEKDAGGDTTTGRTRRLSSRKRSSDDLSDEHRIWIEMAGKFYKTTETLLMSHRRSPENSAVTAGGTIYDALVNFCKHCETCSQSIRDQVPLIGGEWGVWERQELKRLNDRAIQERNTWMLLADYYRLRNNLWDVSYVPIDKGDESKGSFVTFERADGGAFFRAYGFSPRQSHLVTKDELPKDALDVHLRVPLKAAGSSAQSLRNFRGTRDGDGEGEMVRRWRVARRWLEKIARERVRADKPSHDETEPWKGTYQLAKNRDSSIRLDPDMPLRFGHNDKLDELDAATEEKMLRSVWQWLRAGDVAEARRVCEEYGQSWRAASLLGGEPLDDDVHLALNPSDREATSEEMKKRAARRRIGKVYRRGNPNRWLWKHSCWLLSRPIDRTRRVAPLAGAHGGDRGGSMMSGRDIERVIYAAACGNAPALLGSRRHCGSWEDQCWALLVGLTEWVDDRNLLEHRRRQVEQRLMFVPGVVDKKHEMDVATKAVQRSKDALAECGVDCDERKGKGALRDIFKRLRYGESAEAKRSAAMPMRVLQAEIMMGLYDDLIQRGDCGELVGGTFPEDGTSSASLSGFLRSVKSASEKSSAAKARGADELGVDEGVSADIWRPDDDDDDDVGADDPFDAHLLFAAHLVLYLREARREAEERGRRTGSQLRTDDARDDDAFGKFQELGDDILEAFTWQLVERRQYELVTLYMSQISKKKRRLEAYAAFLQSVPDMANRKACVDQARKYEVLRDEVPTIMDKTVRRILSDEAPRVSSSSALIPASSSAIVRSPFEGPTGESVAIVSRTTSSEFTMLTEADPPTDEAIIKTSEQKLKAIHWLCSESAALGSEKCVVAVKHANRLMREIVQQKSADGVTSVWPENLPVARKLLLGDGSMLTKECLAAARSARLSHKEDMAHLKECDDWTLFVDAYDSHLQWRRKLLKAKASERASFIASYATGPEGDQYDDDIARTNAKERELERHIRGDNETNTIVRIVEHTTTILLRMLMNHWLEKKEPQIDDELQRIRRDHVLRLVQMQHVVLFETALWIRSCGSDDGKKMAVELLRRSLKVSILVANEKCRLYKSMDSEGIQSVIRMARRSALELLDMTGSY